jgi:bacteriophage N4 adsorption protein B
VIDGAAHEVMLFAAVGFLIGGIDDLVVDAIYFSRLIWRKRQRVAEPTLVDLPPPERPVALFVPAWDESAVIGKMLRTVIDRWRHHPDLRIYVGAYPNDWDTIQEVSDVALIDNRVRLVIGRRAGPTTKADCLNTLWTTMLEEERTGLLPAAAIVLHDAEDVVHPGELTVYDALIPFNDAIQLPVLPLVDPTSRWIGGTYLDEFAEAHAKLLVVRQAVGAGIPFAGVGCAISRDMLAQVAASRDGLPFDPGSLTEDYELGLTIGELGGQVVTARIRERRGGDLVATTAFFPNTLTATVRQRARWMVGIALAGWDRVGWNGATSLADYWMRMRDRRSPLALVVLFAAYLSLLLWGIILVRVAVGGPAMPPIDRGLALMLWITTAMVLWRLVVRAGFVALGYGPVQALLSVPRLVLANVISLLAVRRALGRYIMMVAGAKLHWDKTDHRFPDDVQVPGA